MSNIHKKIAAAKNKLPYTFVPVKEKTKGETITPAKFNKTEKGGEALYSGHLDCSLYALNYLLVGNEQKTQNENQSDVYTQIFPLKIDEIIHISPYTLKSCISNFLAAFKGLKMKRVIDAHFSFRPNISLQANPKHNNAQTYWASGIVTRVDNDEIGFVKIDGLTKFFHTERHPFVNLNEYSKNQGGIEKTYIAVKMKGQKRIFKYYCFSYQNGIDGLGYLVEEHLSHLTEKERKNSTAKSHNSIGFACNYYKNATKNNKEMRIKKTKLEQFHNTMKFMKKYFKNHNSLTNKQKDNILESENWEKISTFSIGDPIFFEYNKSNNKIMTFGKTFYYPWVYDRSVHDFKDDIRSESDISIVEEMFGYSYSTDGKNHSKSGKVYFNFAKPTKKHKTASYILKRPGGPQASSYEFYIQQDVRNENINSYGEPLNPASDNRLSGRKFYRSMLKPNLPIIPKREKYCVEIKDVIQADDNRFPEFKFRINFENLTSEELKFLHFALILDELDIKGVEQKIREKEEFFCHQIGYGKNFGMGAIKILVSHSLIIPNIDFNNALTKNDTFKSKKINDFEIISYIKELKANEYLVDAFKLHFPKKPFDYPRYHDSKSWEDAKIKDEERTIKWHGDIRKEYAEKRRTSKPKNQFESKEDFNKAVNELQKKFGGINERSNHHNW